MSKPNQKIILGTHEIYDTQFGVTAGDLRLHAYVIGKTGSGKTTLLRNLLLQLIHAGHGVGLIDPHGDLAEELLDLIPPSRSSETVYFNPPDRRYPVSFNVLAQVPRDQRPLVAQGIVSALKSIWRDSWGPRMEHILYHALAALLDCQNVSLLGLSRMLIDPGFRSWVMRQVKDPVIRFFWEREFASWEARFQREAVAPILNKVGAFIGNPITRHIIGQIRSRITPLRIMDSGQIFIANLSKGLIGPESADLLGSLLMSRFQVAAMERIAIPEPDRRQFFLIVDEFQNFGSDLFASLLSEARKFRLSLILSHQFTTQLKPEILQAVFGNVGSLVAFRVGHTDADQLASEFGEEYAPSTFVDLNPFSVICRVPDRQNTGLPFSGKTLPPITSSFSHSNSIKTGSRRNYSIHRSVISSRLARWYDRHF